MQVCIQSVGLVGPGLDGWACARSIFAGQDPYRLKPTPQLIPDILASTERRRSSDVARLAIAAAQEALRSSGLAGDQVATVFASSDGDGRITDQICAALARFEREISPTSFHNSVHNAPAGYWSIATGSQLASTNVCAYDLSFAAGLLEAAAQTIVEHQPVMLIASDLPFPVPLHVFRPVEHSFAAAILMTPSAAKTSLMRWDIGFEPSRPATSYPEELPRSLYSNPAARCLPLLATLARGKTETVSLDYLDDDRSLVISCEPVV